MTKIDVYKIEPIENMDKPLYAKPSELKQAFEFLDISALKKDFRISKKKMEDYDYEIIPEHSGF